MSEPVKEPGDRRRDTEAVDRKDGVNGLRPPRILAVSGSLRAMSSNTALLRAAGVLSGRGAEISPYDRLADLPHFNPDLDDPDRGAAPPPVLDLRARLRASDGVLVASPEYAHGVPGALKNALDWVVGTGELYGKPVALLNASATATHAHASLVEILQTADADVILEASVRVGLPNNRSREADILADPELSGTLRRALETFVLAVEDRRSAGGGRDR